ncbi:MAG: radical SAM protein [Candidatus Diapherotrites archaeon]|nr:radical SAM protein [Candidatus Diapherotrites archaeon]
MDYKIVGKRVIVSFGQKCCFDCKYCYTFSKNFDNFTKRSAKEIFKALQKLDCKKFDTIYLSCDMEPFVNEKEAVKLIMLLSGLGKNIHFTTKKVLSKSTLNSLVKINNALQKKGCLLIPAVTIAAMKSASFLEPAPIPSVEDRINFIKTLSKCGFKVIFAMRPFLPVVGLEEYKGLIDLVKNDVACVLGGIFYFDSEGVIEGRIGCKINLCEESLMDFVDNYSKWYVYSGEKEREFVNAYCAKNNIKFFMRSKPAINYICGQFNSADE